MSDIFISYENEDKAKAQIIARVLIQEGYTVWWDRVIPPGRNSDEVIEEELNAAKSVLVLWSRKSVSSNVVKEEADRGKKRNILVPILIDEVVIPLGFSRIQAARLADWQGTLPDPEFDLLLKSISKIVNPSSIKKPEIPEPTPEKESPPKHTIDYFKNIVNTKGSAILTLLIIGFFATLIIIGEIDRMTPHLNVSQESFLKKDFIFLEENTSSFFTLSISNSTPATLDWNVKVDQPWITTNRMSGSDKGDVRIEIKTSGLGIGSYKGNISVTSNGGNWIKDINLIILPFNGSATLPKIQTLGVHEEWDLERGYSLTPLSINSKEGKENPKSVELVLSRNGEVIKSSNKLLYEGNTYFWDDTYNIFRATIMQIFSKDGSDMVTLGNVTIS